jgi:hypothetical protein
VKISRKLTSIHDGLLFLLFLLQLLLFLLFPFFFLFSSF